MRRARNDQVDESQIRRSVRYVPVPSEWSEQPRLQLVEVIREGPETPFG
ncbi:hypothetical protein [Nocardia carnea]|uniref:Uncharacterized protein n=1 Tax=Nocardia carnea TaxID=37328 RepID=A0ABW7TPG4_9NOCA|nr:hypothetical protein [Nocardia carnea]